MAKYTLLGYFGRLDGLNCVKSMCFLLFTKLFTKINKLLLKHQCGGFLNAIFHLWRKLHIYIFLMKSSKKIFSVLRVCSDSSIDFKNERVLD